MRARAAAPHPRPAARHVRPAHQPREEVWDAPGGLPRPLPASASARALGSRGRDRDGLRVRVPRRQPRSARRRPSCRARAGQDDPRQRRGWRACRSRGSPSTTSPRSSSRDSGVQHILALHRLSDLRAAGDDGSRQQASPRACSPRRDDRHRLPPTRPGGPRAADALGLSSTEASGSATARGRRAVVRRRPLLRGPPPPLRPRMGADDTDAAMAPRHSPPPRSTRASLERPYERPPSQRWHARADRAGALCSPRRSRRLARRRDRRLARRRPSARARAGRRRAGARAAALAPRPTRARVAREHAPHAAGRARAADRARVLHAPRPRAVACGADAAGTAAAVAARPRAARLASRGELTELHVRRPQPGRITLGVHNGRLIAAERRASVLGVGPAQSGKTSGLIVPGDPRMGRPGCSRPRSRATSSTTRTRARQRGEVLDLRPDRLHRPADTRRGRRSPPPAPGRAPGARPRNCSASATTAGALSRRGFWRPAGARFLAPLLLAAAHGELTMREVLCWVATVDEARAERAARGLRRPRCAAGARGAALGVGRPTPACAPA